MKTPKPRLLPSGSWFIQMRLGGKSISKSFETKEAAILWAETYKKTYKKTYPSAIKRQSDYERILRGLVKEDTDEIIKEKRQIPSISAELELVDSMDGVDFEKYCADLLLMTGFFNGGHFYTTKKSSDFGADVIIECLDGLRVSVQCKRCDSNVGIDAIQEVLGSKKHYHTYAAAVFTNSHFTKSAKELAKDNGVALFDRKYLIKLINIKLQTLKKIWNSNQWEELLLEIGMISDGKRKK